MKKLKQFYFLLLLLALFASCIKRAPKDSYILQPDRICDAAGGKGKEAYQFVADSDAKGTSPGSKVFVDLFRKYGPVVILIDEWVAYARQVVGKRDLPSGDFESQTSFAQALTEAAKAAEKTLVVASIPASKPARPSTTT